ncbi:MAG: PEGA domain-containing protein [Archangiaceae bacterium]|nr:PEGA domain-containing protein [Archangiaceae bacterium]
MGKDALGEVFTEKRGGRLVQVRRMIVAQSAVAEVVAEATAAMSLSHASIVQPLEVKADGGLVTVVTEAIEARTLRGLLTTLASTGEKLPVSHATWLAIKLLEALEQAQARKVDGRTAPLFHGRLSPEHVLLTSIGEVRLTGWGLDAAARSLVRPVAKTDPAFAYLSPEQVAGSSPGAASDNFSVGAILVEALLGKPLFVEDTFAQTFEAISNRSAPALRDARDNVPKALDEAVAWALDKVADRRASRPEALRTRLEAFQGMLDVGDRIKPYEHPKRLADLMRLRMKAPATATDVTSMEPTRAEAPASRRRPLLWLLRLLFVGLVGAFAYFVWQDWRDLEPKIRARIPPQVATPLGIDQEVVLPVDAGVDAGPADAGLADGGAADAGVADAGALAPLPALLTIESVPPKATVQIDGRTVGVTPLTRFELPAGEHEVVVISKKLHVELSQSVSLVPGESKKLTVKLKRR